MSEYKICTAFVVIFDNLSKKNEKREIKCKKSRKRKKGLTNVYKSDKINKSPRERAIKEKAKRR